MYKKIGIRAAAYQQKQQISGSNNMIERKQKIKKIPFRMLHPDGDPKIDEAGLEVLQVQLFPSRWTIWNEVRI